MISDVYMIILTALALFGAYSFAEQLIVICRQHNSPKSVTVMKYEKDLNLYHAINHIRKNTDTNSCADPQHRAPPVTGYQKTADGRTDDNRCTG